MYNTDDLVTEIVTLKLSNGIEVVSKLNGVDDDLTTLTLEDPRIVVVNAEDNTLALVPYVFTGVVGEVIMNAHSVLSVQKTGKETAEDYIKIVAEDLEKEESKDS